MIHIYALSVTSNNYYWAKSKTVDRQTVFRKCDAEKTFSNINCSGCVNILVTVHVCSSICVHCQTLDFNIFVTVYSTILYKLLNMWKFIQFNELTLECCQQENFTLMTIVVVFSFIIFCRRRLLSFTWIHSQFMFFTIHTIYSFQHSQTHKQTLLRKEEKNRR